MSDEFEDRMRGALRTHAGKVQRPQDPVADVRRRVRRQDVVRRSVSGLAAVAAVALVVTVGLPNLDGDVITFDGGVADGQDADQGGGDRDGDVFDGGSPDDGVDEDTTTDPDGGDGSGDGDEGAGDCSAADADATVSAQPDLPAAVRETRQAIVDSVVRCDIDGLARLASDRMFTYSFGGGDDPAGHWRRAEESGDDVLHVLVELLDRPYSRIDGADGDLFVWPSAFSYDRWADVPDDVRDSLRPLYDEEDFAAFEAFGSYHGHRVGITADGEWVFFVAGD